MLAPPDRVLLDEGESNLRLAGSYAVGIDHSATLANDSQRSLETLPLERCELDRLRAHLLTHVVAEKLQQRLQVDVARRQQSHLWKQEFVKALLVVGSVVPELVEPLQGAPRHVRVVVDKAQFEVPPHAGGGQIRRCDERCASVAFVAE